MYPHLPVEILHYIALELALDYRSPARDRSICKCMLVDATWYHVARTHVFADITISRGLHPEHVCRLLSLLEDTSNPPLAPVVRALRIVNGVPGHTEAVRFINDPTLTRLLNRLLEPDVQLQTFSLHLGSCEGYGDPMAFRFFQPQVQAALHAVCISPHLKELEISHILGIPGDFLRESNVERLSIGYSTSDIDHNILNKREAWRVPTRLQRVKVFCLSSHVPAWAAGTLYHPLFEILGFNPHKGQLSSIKSLEISHTNTNNIQALLNACPNVEQVTIENLVLDPVVDKDHSILDFGQLHSLSQLSLEASLFLKSCPVTRKGHVSNASKLETIKSILQSLATPPNVIKLEVNVFLGRREPSLPKGHNATFLIEENMITEWKEIASVLKDQASSGSVALLITTIDGIGGSCRGVERDKLPEWESVLRSIFALPVRSEPSRFVLEFASG